MLKTLQELGRKMDDMDNGSIEIRLQTGSDHYKELLEFLSRKDLVDSLRKRVC